jgi:hypothetical protein
LWISINKVFFVYLGRKDSRASGSTYPVPSRLTLRWRLADIFIAMSDAVVSAGLIPAPSSSIDEERALRIGKKRRARTPVGATFTDIYRATVATLELRLAAGVALS